MQDAGGRWLLIRHHPYLAAENRIDGVVLTFVDVTEMKETELELRRSEALIAQEVAALRRLHKMTEEVVTATQMQDALNEILDASIDLLQADFGNIQLLDGARGILSIVAQRGFKRPFLDRFREVDANESSACGQALRLGHRVMIKDVTADPEYTSSLEAAQEAGYRAVQSTPLTNHEGEIVGMLSNHFRKPRTLSERDKQWLDLLAYLEGIYASQVLNAGASGYLMKDDLIQVAAAVRQVYTSGRYSSHETKN